MSANFSLFFSFSSVSRCSALVLCYGFGLLLLGGLPGCHALKLPERFAAPSLKASQAESQAEQVAAIETNTAEQADESTSKEAELAELREKLLAAGRLDEASVEQAIKDARSNPALLRQYQAMANFTLAEKDKEAAEEEPEASGGSSTSESVATAKADSTDPASTTSLSSAPPEPAVNTATATALSDTRMRDNQIHPVSHQEVVPQASLTPGLNPSQEEMYRQVLNNALRQSPVLDSANTNGLSSQIAFLAANANMPNGVAAPPVSPAPPAVQEPAPKEDTSTWRTDLRRAIDKLEMELRDSPDGLAGMEGQAKVRLLHLVAGNTEDAMRSIEGVSPAVQDFWREEIYGLGTMLDPIGISDPMSRRTLGAERLEDALSRLRAECRLELQNLCLVAKGVSRFGEYEELGSYEFHPGDELLFYVEPKNLTFKPWEGKYQTSRSLHWEVLNRDGIRVIDLDPTEIRESYFRSPDMPYYINRGVHLPSNLVPGTYVLRVTVTDLNNSAKSDSRRCEFRVISTY